MSISIMSIDTQQMANRLTAVGIPQAHASELASVIAGAVEHHHAFNLETLCSKRDFEHAVARLQGAIDVLAERLAAVEQRMVTKEDVANLRTEIVSSEKRIILWVVGGFILAQLLPDFLQRFGIT